jgi:diaminopimelate decarboxylase
VLSAQAVAARRIAKVSLRINPDVDARTHPYISTGLKGNKFGIAHGQALASYRRAAGLPGLKVVGIDCHIGSQITQIAPYIDALDRLLDLIEAVEAEGIAIEHLDLGGGLGIAYNGEAPPRPEELVARLVQHIDARGHGHRELMFEPGRSLVGNAGVLLTTVLYLKPGAQVDGDDSAKNFCIVDAAMNDLMRPALYQSWMGIEPCRPRGGPASHWDVVGPVCESGDWLGRDRALSVQPGDVLAVLSAGAYAMAMASNYNSRARAAEVMIVDGQPLLIREREAVADLWKHERLLP